MKALTFLKAKHWPDCASDSVDTAIEALVRKVSSTKGLVGQQGVGGGADRFHRATFPILCHCLNQGLGEDENEKARQNITEKHNIFWCWSGEASNRLYDQNVTLHQNGTGAESRLAEVCWLDVAFSDDIFAI